MTGLFDSGDVPSNMMNMMIGMMGGRQGMGMMRGRASAGRHVAASGAFRTPAWLVSAFVMAPELVTVGREHRADLDVVRGVRRFDAAHARGQAIELAPCTRSGVV